MVREISASRRICASSVALASAFLILSKAWVIVSFQNKVLVWLVSTSKGGGGGGDINCAAAGMNHGRNSPSPHISAKL